MSPDIFTDKWFIEIVTALRTNYTILTGIVFSVAGGLIKVLAIRHPGVSSNTIKELIKVLVGINIESKESIKARDK